MRLLAAVLLLLLPAAATLAQGEPGPFERDRDCRRQAQRVARIEESVMRQLAPGGNPIALPILQRIQERYRNRYADACLDLNQIRSLGTHNSYHIRPRPAFFALLHALVPEAIAWDYTNLPLDEQFENQGVRQIELDVFADPNGGLYALRPALAFVQDPIQSPDPEMSQPGLKVLHVQEVDFESTCLTFVDCLLVVKAWSDAHPRHLPLTILVELKDEVIPDPFNLGFAIPIPFGPVELDTLDAEIRSVFPPSQLLTPDDVRLPGETLEASVLGAGWPLLGEARGLIMFAMDNGGSLRSDYLVGRPNLEGRVLFTNGVPGTPDAAFVKRNDPVGALAEIQSLVKQGYLVRTRADADTVEGRSGDTTRRDAALASGAHFVSSDFPVPNPIFGTGYQVQIPGGAPSGCNPLTAPPGCRSVALEPEGGLPAH